MMSCEVAAPTIVQLLQLLQGCAVWEAVDGKQEKVGWISNSDNLQYYREKKENKTGCIYFSSSLKMVLLEVADEPPALMLYCGLRVLKKKGLD